MGTISKIIKYHMESFWKKHQRLAELTHPGWGDTANYFRETDMKYGTSELHLAAVSKPQADSTTATP
jgi:hypothetical protein